jgi:CubicO group peptidase (beta-lactamase class C family)
MDLEPIIDRARDEVREIMDRGGVSGASVALVQGGEPVWIEAFGRTCEGGRPVDPHTIFSLQSTSKTITASAVMIAVQRGLLDLDAPITRYVPDFTVSSRHEDAPQEKMTLRLLLGHRAGLTHEAPVGGNFEQDLAAYDTIGFEEHVASISRTWLRYPVGRRYAYSNLGIDLAGHILGNACGMSFAAALKALVFDPLGMADTSVDPDVYGAAENRAIGHQPGMPAVPVRMPMQAAGGVCSSAADTARFAAFHLGRGTLDGREVLRRDLWEEMHRMRPGAHPYALGIAAWTLDLESGPVTCFNHNGGGFGFGSSFWYCPDHGLAWVALFNGQTREGAPHRAFDRVALRPALEAKLGRARPARPPADPVVTPDPANLAPYAGAYVGGLSALSAEVDEQGLALRLPGETALSRLAFTGPDTAYIAEGPGAPHRVRLSPAAGKEGARIELVVEGPDAPDVFSHGIGFDFNDRADLPPGFVGDAYDDKLGDYLVIQWGVPVIPAPLRKRGGYLYLGPMRLTEHQPGLFFTGDGEAVDLRGEAPTIRNIVLHRPGAGGMATGAPSPLGR